MYQGKYVSLFSSYSTGKSFDTPKKPEKNIKDLQNLPGAEQFAIILLTWFDSIFHFSICRRKTVLEPHIFYTLESLAKELQIKNNNKQTNKKHPKITKVIRQYNQQLQPPTTLSSNKTDIHTKTNNNEQHMVRIARLINGTKRGEVKLIFHVHKSPISFVHFNHAYVDKRVSHSWL